MPAQFYFGVRSEPPQQIVVSLLVLEKGSLGKVVFHSNVLHPSSVSVHKHDSCGVASEWLVGYGKGVYLQLLQ